MANGHQITIDIVTRTNATQAAQETVRALDQVEAKARRRMTLDEFDSVRGSSSPASSGPPTRTPPRPAAPAPSSADPGDDPSLRSVLGGAFGKKSDIFQWGKILKGGGAVVGLTLIGSILDQWSEKLLDIQKGWDKLDGVGRAVKIGESLPILGAFVKAGQNIRELVTGEQAAIDLMEEATKSQESYYAHRREFVAENKKRLQEHLDQMAAIEGEQNREGRSPEFSSQQAELRARQKALEDAKKANNPAGINLKIQDEMKNDKTLNDESATVESMKGQIDERRERLKVLQYMKSQGVLIKARAKEMKDIQAFVDRYDASVKRVAEIRKAYEQRSVSENKMVSEDQLKAQQQLDSMLDRSKQQHADRMLDLQAKADQQAMQTRGRDAEAAILKAKTDRDELQRKLDLESKPLPQKASKEEFELQRRTVDELTKAMDIANADLAALQDKAAREAAARRQTQNEAVLDLEEQAYATRLKAAGQNAQAELAQMRATFDAKMRELDREQAEEAQKDPDNAEAIARKYELRRQIERDALQAAGRERSQAIVRQFQDIYKQMGDLAGDHARERDRSVRRSTQFDVEEVGYGNVGLGAFARQEQTRVSTIDTALASIAEYGKKTVELMTQLLRLQQQNPVGTF